MRRDVSTLPAGSAVLASAYGSMLVSECEQKSPIVRPERPKAPFSLSSARQNGLLAALPLAEIERLRPHLNLVSLPLGKVLYEPGTPFTHAYFPTTSILSKVYALADGASSQVAVVGNEGITGVALVTGATSLPTQTVVQSPGTAYRIRAKALQVEFARGGALQRLLLRYLQAFLMQMAQTAVCNRHHSIDQQLCRWLLLSLDRSSSNEIVTTHEALAHNQGVRRESITDAARKLQRAGVIDYSRGRIYVLDRPGLEDRTCECYGVVKGECDRLLPRRAQAWPDCFGA
jgi:CRP-like cAMP-binding protein